METWSGRVAVPSLFHLPILLPETTGCTTFLLWIPPRSAPHTTPHPKVTLSLSLSPVKENSLNHSSQALKLPEYRQQHLWLLSMGPNMRISGKHLGLDQRGKDGESLRHQELVTTWVRLLCCLLLLWSLSVAFQPATGTGKGQVSSLWLFSKHHRGHVGELGNARSEKCQFPRVVC